MISSFRDQLPLAAGQQSEQIERARTERNGNQVAGGIEPEQATAVEAEAFETQVISRPEHLPKLVSAAISK